MLLMFRNTVICQKFNSSQGLWFLGIICILNIVLKCQQCTLKETLRTSVIITNKIIH